MSVRAIVLAAMALFLAIAPGAAADPVFDPDPVEFADQLVGTQSAPISITVTNDSADPYQVSDVFLDGDDAGDFEVLSDSCTGTEVTQATGCAVSVRFRPTASGDRVALLVLDTAGGGDAFGVLVGGFAYDAPTVVASAVDFPPVRRGEGLRHRVVFSNTGEGPVQFGAASIAGPDAAAFDVWVNGCTGRVIAPDASCEMWVTFRPDHEGEHHAELLLVSDAANSPHRASLSGVGIPEAEIRLETAGLDFGVIGAPFGDVTRDIIVRNVGAASARLVPLVPALEPAGRAGIAQNDCARGVSGGESCLVKVTVTPLSPGSLSGTFQVQGFRSRAVLASMPISGEVAGDPSAFMRSSLARNLAAAARAWRRAGRRALRHRGFRMAWTAPFGGTARLRVYAEVPAASARGRRLIARVYDGVSSHPGEQMLRARVTRVGRRLLARRGTLPVAAELRFRLADGRVWDVSRRVRLR